MSLHAWTFDAEGWLRSRLAFGSEAERDGAMAGRNDLTTSAAPECAAGTRARWTEQGWACEAWPAPEQKARAERARARAEYERRGAMGAVWRGARFAGDAESVVRLLLLRDAALDPASGFRAAGEPVRLADGSWMTMRRADVIDAWTALRDRLLELNRQHGASEDEPRAPPGRTPPAP